MAASHQHHHPYQTTTKEGSDEHEADPAQEEGPVERVRLDGVLETEASLSDVAIGVECQVDALGASVDGVGWRSESRESTEMSP
jgi:hypothetical protein